MRQTHVSEYVFFFGVLAVTTYVVWSMIAPFFGALTIASIIAVVGYPLYYRVLRYTPWHNKNIAALITTLLIGLLVITPLVVLGYVLVSQALSLYMSLNQNGGLLFNQTITQVETLVQHFIPIFQLDVSMYVREISGWLLAHTGTIFAETASTAFLIFFCITAVFYLFRDGIRFRHYLTQLSPFSDTQDEYVFRRLTRAVRTMVLGTLAVALIQGMLVTVGFTLFGIGQPVLWGAVAALCALIPGVGTFLLFGPTVAFLFLQGSYSTAIGIAVWGTFTVGLVDNLLGPYLMGRGIALHPFLVLLSVLGGISIFGPVGFILGPVTTTLFVVLLELYSAHPDGPVT